MMTKRIFSIALLACLPFMLAACSGTQAKDETVVTPQPKEKPPECFPGCTLDGQGKCSLMANSMDWSSVEQEKVECDMRCCQAGASGGGSVDTDGDSIYDEQDECVDKPEDFDGHQDTDGCPEPDNDNDGILDSDDLCPLDAEDADGFEDSDGCPEPGGQGQPQE